MKIYKVTVFSLSLALGLCFFMCANPGNKNETTTSQQKDYRFTMVAIPQALTVPLDRANYLVEHYWDNFDFSDTAYVHLPNITEQAMADYVEILPQANKEIAYAAIKNTLLKSEADSVMNAYFLETYNKYLYDPNSPMRNEEYYIPVLSYIIESDKTSETDKERADFRIKMLLKNRVGEKATDFTYTLASGKAGSLHKIKGQHTIAFFYNPDCKACAETIAALKNSSVINEALESNSLSILAFYPDADLEIWKKHLNDIPRNWINGYDKNQTVQNKRLYDLKAIPTLYLLDEDKNIILKDVDFYSLEKYLEKAKPVVLF